MVSGGECGKYKQPQLPSGFHIPLHRTITHIFLPQRHPLYDFMTVFSTANITLFAFIHLAILIFAIRFIYNLPDNLAYNLVSLFL